jgi:hypothetical protein
MILRLSPSESQEWFHRLPLARQISTLSPAYVVADAARDVSLTPLFLGYREDNFFWLHGVHCGRVEQVDCLDFQSAYGYGGPLSNCDDEAFLSRAWTAYSEWCENNQILAEFVRLHPLAIGWQRYMGTVREDRSTVVVPLEVDDISINYSRRCKRSIQKAERGNLESGILPNEEIAKGFPAFYRQGMEDLQADSFYFFSDHYFNQLAKLSNAKLIVARKGSEWVSAAIILIGAEVVEYHLGASSPYGKQLAASSLIHHEIACYAKANGARFYYLGGGTDGSPENSLFVFKSGFSQSRLPFRYGFSIHRPEVYATFKESFERSHGKKPRVLFYR